MIRNSLKENRSLRNEFKFPSQPLLVLITLGFLKFSAQIYDKGVKDNSEVRVF